MMESGTEKPDGKALSATGPDLSTENQESAATLVSENLNLTYTASDGDPNWSTSILRTNDFSVLYSKNNQTSDAGSSNIQQDDLPSCSIRENPASHMDTDDQDIETEQESEVMTLNTNNDGTSDEQHAQDETSHFYEFDHIEPYSVAYTCRDGTNREEVSSRATGSLQCTVIGTGVTMKPQAESTSSTFVENRPSEDTMDASDDNGPRAPPASLHGNAGECKLQNPPDGLRPNPIYASSGRQQAKNGPCSTGRFLCTSAIFILIGSTIAGISIGLYLNTQESGIQMPNSTRGSRNQTEFKAITIASSAGENRTVPVITEDHSAVASSLRTRPFTLHSTHDPAVVASSGSTNISTRSTPHSTVSPKCQLGWSEYNSHCYKLMKETVGVLTAKERCRRMGAKLASVKDSPENKFIASTIKDAEKSTVWIGLVLQKRGYEWTDGTSLSYTNWAEGRPEKSWRLPRREHCVAIFSKNHKDNWWPNAKKRIAGQWIDMSCSSKVPYICKKRSDDNKITKSGRQNNIAFKK